ncbi:hypothetical protein RT723_01830 [Psychrosphaera aquimarina]|uniref:Uncharacterized protein n=1 Tax=Psychrosphaera aquimarina TaxID=2044854 RepID=A0ABU3QWG0_9GAMM|nr:hypothetical protein [Psychrosphaera aquimarina]MDU0111766.1 hypothetical protein [Psychrosphaera aquimarina]
MYCPKLIANFDELSGGELRLLNDARTTDIVRAARKKYVELGEIEEPIKSQK